MAADDDSRRQSALSDVIFALKHGERVGNVEVLERGTNIGERDDLADFEQGQPYLDITIDDHPYRLILEDHG